MVRVITQETFDDVVRENMEEFDMSREEAVREAKEQFEQQGVNLSNIVICEKESPPVLEAVSRLSQTCVSDDEKIANLKSLSDCCKDDLAQRVMATNNGAYSYLIRLASPSENTAVRKASVECLVAVMDTNPDYLEAQGINLMKELLMNSELKIPTLEWLLMCCIRHEDNRQALVGADILEILQKLFKDGDLDTKVKVCRIWMALVQDDDIRVPFGKAHDHAREIVENHETLQMLMSALSQANLEDEQSLQLVQIALSTLSSLSVRNEYCQEVVDKGGLLFLLDVLLNHRTVTDLCMRSLVLLKTLAGNDKVKAEVGKTGGISLIMAAISENLDKARVVEAAFQAIAAVSLRNIDVAKQVMENDGAYLTVTAMARHQKSRKVQSACASAVRNIVSRDRTLCQPFVDQGIEEILNNALRQYEKELGDIVKAALRDLGLGVELVERWSGTSGQTVHN